MSTRRLISGVILKGIIIFIIVGTLIFLISGCMKSEQIDTFERVTVDLAYNVDELREYLGCDYSFVIKWNHVEEEFKIDCQRASGTQIWATAPTFDDAVTEVIKKKLLYARMGVP